MANRLASNSLLSASTTINGTAMAESTMGSHHICTASSPAILSSLSTDDCALANSNYIAPPIKVVRPAKSVSQTKHMEVPMFVGNEKRDLAKFAAQV